MSSYCAGAAGFGRSCFVREVLEFSQNLEVRCMSNETYYKRKRHLEWRKKVLRRDKYLCKECAKYGRRTPATHAHHIRSVKEWPELRYVVSNGVALCAGCHNKIEPRNRIATHNRHRGEAPPPAQAKNKG